MYFTYIIHQYIDFFCYLCNLFKAYGPLNIED